MKTRIEWDGDALILIAGPWRVWVAYVEEYSQERRAQAFLYGWGTESSDLDLNAGSTPGGGPHVSTLEVMCRSRVEATAAIRALYALRDVEVPLAPWEKQR